MTGRALQPPRRVLVRAVNWVGDAVLTLPALAALAEACPGAELAVLARPGVAAVYAGQPGVGRVIPLTREGSRRGPAGLWRLARELASQGFDWAVLLQNAFEAAALAWLARIPVRLGYARDGRRLLLSHPVPCGPGVRRLHQTSYYLHLLHAAGLLAAPPPPAGVVPRLVVSAGDRTRAGSFLAARGLAAGGLLGLAPGAAYGPAKCWPAARFAAAARELVAEPGFAAVVILGGAGEAAACGEVAAGLAGLPVLNLAGQTDLGLALALLDRLGLLLTNDSGLMHAAAALGTPTLAVFGSTDPAATGPRGPRVAAEREPAVCAPCLRPVCPRGDLACFAPLTPARVTAAARRLLAGGQKGAQA